MVKAFITIFFSFVLVTATQAVSITVADINNAKPLDSSSIAALIKLQVLLDRAASSPGVIDGRMGANTSAAIKAYQRVHNLETDGTLNRTVWEKLSKDSQPVARIYKLTNEDMDQQLIADLPEEYADLAKLDCLCFHRVSEAIAEKFHTDEDLVKRLNPDVYFSSAGTEILVTAAVGIKKTKVVRIDVDKKTEQVSGYDANDNLVFFSPATVGSDEMPSPSGTLTVSAVAADPAYTLNARKNLNAESARNCKIAPGPNRPVGSMWIDLSKPTFGIHGTSDPSRISGSYSHGCVRLTNWDANKLAQIVEIGAKVEFIN